MFSYRKTTFLGWAIDALLVTIVITAYWLLDFTVDPFRRGFFCDDESLRYTEKPDSLTYRDSFIIGLGSGVAMILIVDLYLNYSESGKFHFSNFLIILDDIFVFLFGAFGSYVACCIMKLTSGGLRPYFISYCFEDPSDFEALCPPDKKHLFVTNYTCPGSGIHLKNIWMSFPSGHSSLITFSMVFITLYLSKLINIKELQIKFLMPFFQLGFINIALYVAAKRSADYKHNAGDILVGLLNGICFALFCVLYLLNDRKMKDNSRIPVFKQTNSCSYQSIESVR